MDRVEALRDRTRALREEVKRLGIELEGLQLEREQLALRVLFELSSPERSGEAAQDFAQVLLDHIPEFASDEIFKRNVTRHTGEGLDSIDQIIAASRVLRGSLGSDFQVWLDDMKGWQQKSLVCDFCNVALRRETTRIYPTEDFDLITVRTTDQKESLTRRSTLGWAACEDCSRFIDRSDIDGLFYRSVETRKARWKALIGEGIDVSIIKRDMKVVQRRFFQHRSGESRVPSEEEWRELEKHLVVEDDELDRRMRELIDHQRALQPEPVLSLEGREWRQVLDLMIELREFWRSFEGIELARRVIEGAQDLQPLDAEKLADGAAALVELSAPIWVSAQMVDLLEVAAHQMPDQRLLLIDVPMSAGFALLERSIEVSDGYERAPVHAVAWCVSDVITPSSRAGVVFYLYSRAMPLPRFALWEFGTTIAESYERLLRKGVENTVGIKESFFEVLRLFAAFWHLIQQPIAHVSEERAPRQVHKRAERAGIEKKDSIRVVTLRRLRVEREDSETGEKREIEWDHRWIVTGHWRNQFYRSLNTHRLIWINPYVKGPEDKPLVVGQKAYRWVR
jgi:hypothetical protein